MHVWHPTALSANLPEVGLLITSFVCLVRQTSQNGIQIFRALGQHQHFATLIERHLDLVANGRSAILIGDKVAYFSDRGRLFQRDRGRRFKLIVDAQGCAQARK
ncbi:MAG: hypothetical protein PHQ58_02910 [Rhodoferax sp.]|nr:hypothetical protein [Rhodoferax sp.]